MSRSSLEELVSLVDLVEHALVHSGRAFESPDAFPLRGILVVLGEIRVRLAASGARDPVQSSAAPAPGSGTFGGGTFGGGSFSGPDFGGAEFEEAQWNGSARDHWTHPPARLDTIRADTVRSEISRADLNRAEIGRPELPRAEMPRGESGRADLAARPERREAADPRSPLPPAKAGRGLASRIQMSPIGKQGSESQAPGSGSVREISLPGEPNAGESQ